MEISTATLALFLLTIILMVAFIIRIVRTRQVLLIHKFYFAAAIALIVWLLALIGLEFTNPQNLTLVTFWDSTTTMCGTLIPPCSLLFALCYTRGYDKNLPKRYWLLFVIPLLTIIMVYTNNLHHLYYRVFSLESSSVQFGPYFVVHSFYTFSCVALSVICIIRFAIKTKVRLHIRQAILFTVGSLAPSIVNLLLVNRLIEATVVITPISFIVTLVFHGIIIYRLHLFDIQPIAMQQLVDSIGDGYLVLNQAGLIVSCNATFQQLLGQDLQMRENQLFQDCIQNEDVENQTAGYNLLTAIHSCRESNTRITYEQAISSVKNNEPYKSFYMVEVIPLVAQQTACGFLAIFRDITGIKQNMQHLQDSQVKMMEQERLAFLGQMVGGLAHNLKTPIMSISGSVSAVGNLIQESRSSLGDPEVTADDYREIYEEMDSWLLRMQEACAYMSDIINAVKGQASNMSLADSADFTLTEAFKRVTLLLRHELLNSQCALKIEDCTAEQAVQIHGDINNLVQIINNLISNAIDAQIPEGNHEIVIHAEHDKECLRITIKDFGVGIPESVRDKLFQQMVTSKGTAGTGLGVLISNTVIRANFDGTLWFEDNPQGGTVWGISIPMSRVRIAERKEIAASEEE